MKGFRIYSRITRKDSCGSEGVIKDAMPSDAPFVFTGKAAIYYGTDDFIDDKNGHVLMKNKPLAICDKTANALSELNRNDIYISDSTFHYNGGGCC